MNKLVKIIVILLPTFIQCPEEANLELFKSNFEMEYLVYSSSYLTKELEIFFEKYSLNNKVTKRSDLSNNK